jgi:hypothetical protein
MDIGSPGTSVEIVEIVVMGGDVGEIRSRIRRRDHGQLPRLALT